MANRENKGPTDPTTGEPIKTGSLQGKPAAQKEASEQYENQTGGAWASAGRGAASGAALGASVGGLYGAAIGGVLGGIGGLIGYSSNRDAQMEQFSKDYDKAEKDRKEQERRAAVLQRQMATTAQQMSRQQSGGASSVKQPTLSTPAGDELALASMPIATRRGTQYDAWRQQTYGS